MAYRCLLIGCLAQSGLRFENILIQNGGVVIMDGLRDELGAAGECGRVNCSKILR